MLTLLLAWLAPAAVAADILVWEEGFPADHNPIDGHDGWIAGWSGDGWRTDWTNGVRPATALDTPRGWSGDTSTRNHLVNTDQVFGDFRLDAMVNNRGDGALGIVFRYQDAQNYYLAMFTKGDRPSDGAGSQTIQQPGAALLRVQGGVATVLDSVDGDTYAPAKNAWRRVRVEAVGSQIDVWVDANNNNNFHVNERWLSAADGQFGAGHVGLFSYLNTVEFDTLRVRLTDSDGDDVANDDDNCPDDANTDQDDLDGDGIGDACDDDADGDGHDALTDCDDLDASVHPGAAERCNDIDDDCDTLVDEGAVDAPDWYADLDGDGWGSGAPTAACDAPAGHVAQPGDCDDADATRHPTAPEICDGVDQDCDGAVDEDPVGAPAWYADADGDGFGDPNDAAHACAAPPGRVADDTDCDDAVAAVHPGAPELCNGRDDDCDNVVDEDDAVDAVDWYPDLDGDGYGALGTIRKACDQPAGHGPAPDDCDDTDAGIHPGADEHCDLVDEDCDGVIDEDAVDAPAWYADADGDGFGDPGSVVFDCVQPPGRVAEDTDCDDTDPQVRPGVPERCNGIDDDCDQAIDEEAVDRTPWYPDADGDGYGVGAPVLACTAPEGHAPADGDCDDGVASTYPGAFEQCNEIDDDCDGEVDEVIEYVPWYTDADGDGYGDPDTEVVDCLQPDGTVRDGTDCDDTDPAIHPGAEKVPGNDVDEDCSGLYEPGGRSWTPDPDGARNDAIGCGCSTPPSAPSAAWLLTALGLLVARRRRAG